MKRTIIFILCLSLLSVLFVGCKDSSSPPNVDQEEELSIPVPDGPYNPFDSFSLMAEGKSPFLKLPDAFTVFNAVDGHIELVGPKQEYYKNGDTISLKFIYPKDIAENLGLNVEVESSDMTIENMDFYLEKFEDLTEDQKADLFKMGTEEILKYAETDFTMQSEKYSHSHNYKIQSVDDLNIAFESASLCFIKDYQDDSADPVNALYLLAKVPVVKVEADNFGDVDVPDTTDVYCIIFVNDIYISPNSNNYLLFGKPFSFLNYSFENDPEIISQLISQHIGDKYSIISTEFN